MIDAITPAKEPQNAVLIPFTKVPKLAVGSSVLK